MTVRPLGAGTPLPLLAGSQLGPYTARSTSGSLSVTSRDGSLPILLVLDAKALTPGEHYGITLVATSDDGGMSGVTVTFSG